MKKRWLAIVVAVVMVIGGLNVVAFGTGDTEEPQPVEAVQAEPEKKAEAPKTEAPAEAPKAEEPVAAPAEEAPVAEAPAEEIPAEETPVEEVPAEETGAEEAPVEETPAEEVPAEETPAEEIPAEEETPAEETPVEEAPAEEIPAEEIPEEEAVEELQVSLSEVSRYVFAGESAHAKLTVSGGVAPYVVSFEGEEIVMNEAGTADLSLTAKKGGELEIKVEVTDAEGAQKSVSATVPVAVDRKGDYKKFLKAAKKVKLTGDWRVDIVAVAKSQLGYKESTENFIIRDDGSKQGWTLYGEEYGLPYEEWCAMFATFCVREALGDYKGYFPVDSGCQNWIEKLGGAYVNDEDNYDPKPGDLIFFNKDEESDADHVGIVEYAEGSTVHTIEGNSSRSVQRCSYSMSDKSIMGYANIEVLMKNAGLIEEPAESEPSEEDIEETEETEETELPEDGEMEAVVDELLEDMLGDMPVIVDELIEGEEAPEMTEEIAAWAEEVGATEEMIARALKAGSLDCLILEGDQLIFVRSGEAMATYDAETGAIKDNQLGLIVCYLSDLTSAEEAEAPAEEIVEAPAASEEPVEAAAEEVVEVPVEEVAEA